MLGRIVYVDGLLDFGANFLGLSKYFFQVDWPQRQGNLEGLRFLVPFHFSDGVVKRVGHMGRRFRGQGRSRQSGSNHRGTHHDGHRETKLSISYFGSAYSHFRHVTHGLEPELSSCRRGGESPAPSRLVSARGGTILTIHRVHLEVTFVRVCFAFRLG